VKALSPLAGQRMPRGTEVGIDLTVLLFALGFRARRGSRRVTPASGVADDSMTPCAEARADRHRSGCARCW